MSKYYAVRTGNTSGIYRTWDETKIQVNGFKGAEYKSFKTEKEAQNYMVNDELVVFDVGGKDKVINKVVSNGKMTAKDENLYDIVIYTDGSCIDYVGGYGIVVIDKIQNDIYERYGYIPDKSTNQVAELYAIKEAVFLMHDNKDKKILIKSDSMYSIKCLTTYIHKWKRNGYKTAKNEPVKNLNIILQIYEMLANFKHVEFEHVYGHVGIEYNERADKLANQGRQLGG